MSTTSSPRATLRMDLPEIRLYRSSAWVEPELHQTAARLVNPHSLQSGLARRNTGGKFEREPALPHPAQRGEILLGVVSQVNRLNTGLLGIAWVLQDKYRVSNRVAPVPIPELFD